MTCFFNSNPYFIASPLEQFNILSLHDVSLGYLSDYDIVQPSIFLFIWSLFYYLPLSVYLAIDSFLEHSLPLPWVTISFFSVFFSFFLNAASFIIYHISTWPYFLFGLFSAKQDWVPLFCGAAIGIDVGRFFFFFWDFAHTFSISSASLFQSATYQASSFSSYDLKLALFSGSLGVFSGGAIASTIYFLFSDFFLFLFSQVSAFTVNILLNLSTKDLSHLILSLNTSTIWLLLGFSFITFLFTTILTRITLLPKNYWQTILESLYTVILDIVNDNAGPKGIKHFPLIFTTFMLILICNILGMIPYSFTVTSHLIVTFCTALAIFIGINIIGILKHRKHFLSLFFPPGAPLALAPLLVFIELVSYVFRVLSLAIRLFANLMSGHTLLKILSSFGWAAVSFWGLFLIPFGIIFLITGLEIAIACLQAYIFSVLLCIYINDAFNLH